MPRLAATILGLFLAAISIGFNTVRYPVVWEMVGPVKTILPEPSAATAQPEKTEHPMLTERAEKPAISNAAPVVEMDIRKPLVPVTPVSSSGVLGSAAAGGGGIRRLPPVGHAGVNLAPTDATVSYGAPIPIYPTTGIE